MRSLGIVRSLALGIGIMVALLAVAWGPWATAKPAAAQALPDRSSHTLPGQLFQHYVDALDDGDVAGAMTLFTDDAVVAGVCPCDPAECVGKDAIWELTEYLVGDNTRVAVGSSEVSEYTATGTAELASDDMRATGVDRMVYSFSLEMSGGRISDLRLVANPNDPQKARGVAFEEEGPETVPGTAAVAGSAVAPRAVPAAGSGGLPGGERNGLPAWWYRLAAAGGLLLVVSLTGLRGAGSRR